jgi:4-diphosphocytidyl-2C-methyl-D-erythritol kinase
LSGSGAALYGLFESSKAAEDAAAALNAKGIEAWATKSLTRAQYWKQMFE